MWTSRTTSTKSAAPLPSRLCRADSLHRPVGKVTLSQATTEIFFGESNIKFAFVHATKNLELMRNEVRFPRTLPIGSWQSEFYCDWLAVNLLGPNSRFCAPQPERVGDNLAWKFSPGSDPLMFAWPSRLRSTKTKETSSISLKNAFMPHAHLYALILNFIGTTTPREECQQKSRLGRGRTSSDPTRVGPSQLKPT